MKRILFILLALCFVISCEKKDDEPNPSTDYMIYDNSEGLIGLGGGKITLNDQNSPIDGVCIDIPQGALTREVKISAQLDNSKRPIGDSLVNIINFQPDGISFSKPVTLKIPISNTIQNPGLFYYNSDSGIIRQIPITEIDKENGFISAQINHFSRYFIEDKTYAFFDAFLYNIGSTIKAKVKFGGDYGLVSIPVNRLNLITSLGTISNAKQAIDVAIPGLGTAPENFYGTIRVDLLQGTWLNKKTVKSLKLAIRRRGQYPVKESWVDVKMVNPEDKMLFTSGILNSQIREDFFSGQALVFDFNSKAENGKDYFLELSWCLSDNYNAYWLASSRFTNVYEVNTYDNYPAWTTTTMLSTDPDKNNNSIDDKYDIANNAAPSQPSSPTPANNTTGISTSPSLSWSCSDPESDPLTYDVFFGTSNPPTTKISSAQTAASISRSNLSSGTKYYWSVVAKDNHNNSTTGTVWNFTTQAVTGSAPVAAFNANPTSGTAPLAVNFTDQSTNNPTSWSWNFGDGSSISTQRNPSHTYSTAGTYTVSLTATNSYGSDSETRTITVNAAGTAPVAAFNANPISGTTPLAVSFTDQSTNDPTSWSWNFGDGSSISTQRNPSHTYSTAGTYTVSLTATNSYGSDSETRTITVNAAGTAPAAAFTATPINGTAPLAVSFTDQSTNDPTSWSWNFGDGGTSTSRNPSHTYSTVGTYSVSLTATNSFDSDTETKTSYITVTENGGGETQVVDVTNPVTGKTWMDRNLGASRAATSSTDAQAYGDLYQWGRAADGHEKRTSGTTSSLSSSNTPGHGSFITSASSPYDWRSPQNSNLWQGASGTNKPCPAGYRLPTEAEWVAETQSWGSKNTAGAFGSPLKLTLAGYRYSTSGSLHNVGNDGGYWSSTVQSINSRYLGFRSSSANMLLSDRGYGFSVRCLKD